MKRTVCAGILLIAVFLQCGCTKHYEPIVGIPAETAEPAETGTASEENAEEYDAEAHSLALCTDIVGGAVQTEIIDAFMTHAGELGYTDVRIISSEDENEMAIRREALTFAKDGGSAALFFVSVLPDGRYINDLRKAGCIVGCIGFDRTADGKLQDGMDFAVSSTASDAGEKCAAAMAENVNDTGNILLLSYEGSTRGGELCDAFADKWNSVASDRNANVMLKNAVLSEYGYECADEIRALLGEDTRGVLCTYAGALDGCVRAIESAGLEGVTVIGTAETDNSAAYIADGKVLSVYSVPYAEHTRLAVDYIDTLLRGGSVPDAAQVEGEMLYAGTDRTKAGS